MESKPADGLLGAVAGRVCLYWAAWTDDHDLRGSAGADIGGVRNIRDGRVRGSPFYLQSYYLFRIFALVRPFCHGSGVHVTTEDTSYVTEGFSSTRGSTAGITNLRVPLGNLTER